MFRRIVFHTSDWHLGKNRKYADHLEQQRFMLQAIRVLLHKTIIENPSAEIWCIMAGDVFDRNEDTRLEEFALAMSYFLAPFIELENIFPNFHWWAIDGNHDRKPYSPDDPHSECSLLSPLIKFAPNNIVVQNPKYIEDKNLLLIPFNGYDEQGLRANLTKYPLTKYLVIHECLNTIKTDKNWTPRKQDRYIDIKNILKDYELSGVFVGDIHRSQCLDDAGICWYSGSPTTLDHSHEMPKGVLIHTYQNDVPVSHDLIPLGDPKIKTHKQFGFLKDLNKIPMDELNQFENYYYQLIVSPEVYAVIDKAIPLFFSSPNVSWEFPRERPTLKSGSVENEEEKEDYYVDLINQWIADNTMKLSAKEKQDLAQRLLLDFQER
jgi:DNA repair exonuclease SbcCD nuclease subunit